MHEEGTLVSVVENGLDGDKNPLLNVVKAGSNNFLAYSTMAEKYPRYFQNVEKAKKKNGCCTFILSFLKRHYRKELHEDFGVQMSQVQYVHVAILYGTPGYVSLKILHALIFLRGDLTQILNPPPPKKRSNAADVTKLPE